MPKTSHMMARLASVDLAVASSRHTERNAGTMPLMHSLHLPTLCSSQNPNPNPKSPPLSSPHPPLLLRFRPSRRQKIQYLKTLGVDTSSSSSSSSSLETLDWILSIVDYLRSKGFFDSHFPRLSFLCPRIFSSADIDRTLAPVFAFLATDLSADHEQARDLILRCPELLVSNVEYRLRPTLQFLHELGLKNLNSPTNLNAHLLNTPIEKLVSKIRFLENLGFSYEESAGLCARCPAIFGYSVENNLRPKIEYLVNNMGRSVAELKKFPQYLAFSLKKRIIPRHLHLKQRNVQIPLQRMLLWSDERFYAKWK